jgi:cardiolipin synthase
MAGLPRWLLIAGGASCLSLIIAPVVSNFIGGEKKIKRHIARLYALDDPRFMNELGVLLGPPFLNGTRIRALLNGEEIFPPMLAAIRSAKVSITFETYIYWSGDIGREFADALAERALQGVKVHVLLDWVGSARMDQSLVASMSAAGVKVRQFHPPHWSHLGRLNNRTHRKLLVIDGRVGFTGGVGVAPQWTGRAQDPAHWRDTHFEVEGPVVAQMQSVFIDNWIKVTGDVFHGPDYFPALEPAGRGMAQMFSSSPSGGSDSMQLMYLLAVTSASRSIDLSASYFDGLLTSVGSTNFDNRSFRLNDEATLNVVDQAFASAQTSIFESDLARSRQVTYAQWRERPLRERLGEMLASVVDTQL